MKALHLLEARDEVLNVDAVQALRSQRVLVAQLHQQASSRPAPGLDLQLGVLEHHREGPQVLQPEHVRGGVPLDQGVVDIPEPLAGPANLQERLWNQVVGFRGGRSAYVLLVRGPDTSGDLFQALDQVLHGEAHVIRVKDLAQVPHGGAGRGKCFGRGRRDRAAGNAVRRIIY